MAILEHLKAAWSEAVEQAKEGREYALDRAKATVVLRGPGSLADSMLADEFRRGRKAGLKEAIDLLKERGDSAHACALFSVASYLRGAASELHSRWVGP
jgi:hypothetical protein